MEPNNKTKPMRCGRIAFHVTKASGGRTRTAHHTTLELSIISHKHDNIIHIHKIIHLFAHVHEWGHIWFYLAPLLYSQIYRRLIMIRTCNRLLTYHVLCMHSQCTVHVRNEWFLCIWWHNNASLLNTYLLYVRFTRDRWLMVSWYARAYLSNNGRIIMKPGTNITWLKTTSYT
jgi:hypothetical protein